MPTPSHGSSAASPEVEFDLLREDFLAKFEEVYVPCANIEIGLVCLFVCLFVSLFVSLLACLFPCLLACLLACLFVCLLACLFVQHFRFSPDALASVVTYQPFARSAGVIKTGRCPIDFFSAICFLFNCSAVTNFQSDACPF